ncbi:A/G-specific adenine glycosylase, partial [Acidobacteria bacterium AH-259-D05]|nr:A/G-specific adenine glycosylase [Acidobacteria bacterium AH-259-D05]
MEPGTWNLELRLPIPVTEFAFRLLSWYADNKRDLPWRDNPDPYQVWVSEVMLQQTQVKTVLPYYRRFLKTYPTLQALAKAEESEILTSWSGLGYYSRARSLHKAARMVSERWGGQFPRDYNEAIQLPGIGRYTAGAILSIAHQEPLPILDGNIARFLTRYLCIEEDPGHAAVEKLWKFLAQLVRESSVSSHIADFNQALMEIGSLVCVPRNPQCASCPLRESCVARKAGLQTTLPRRRKGRQVQEFHYTVALVAQGEKYLLMQNWQETFLRGFWEFPRVKGRPTPHVGKTFQKMHGLDLKVEQQSATVTHRITFRKLNFHPVVMTLLSPIPGNKFTWTKPGE